MGRHGELPTSEPENGSNRTDGRSNIRRRGRDRLPAASRLVGSTDGQSLVCPADLNAMASIREAAGKIAREMGFSEGAIADIELAVGEAAVNAANHGSPNGAADSFSVRFYPGKSALIIEISDHGPGFDLARVKRLSPTCLREGGRGIFLIRSLMDHTEFTRGHGTTVRMTKRLVPI